jgi:hypothetical protein
MAIGSHRVIYVDMHDVYVLDKKDNAYKFKCSRKMENLDTFGELKCFIVEVVATSKVDMIIVNSVDCFIGACLSDQPELKNTKIFSPNIETQQERANAAKAYGIVPKTGNLREYDLYKTSGPEEDACVMTSYYFHHRYNTN